MTMVRWKQGPIGFGRMRRPYLKRSGVGLSSEKPWEPVARLWIYIAPSRSAAVSANVVEGHFGINSVEACARY